MSIPFWRLRGYLEDGVSGYQCLHCGNGWDASTDPGLAGWRFCPYCGCEWEGERKCRTHYVPRWEYERWGEQGMPSSLRYDADQYSPEWYARRQAAEDAQRVWVIERRHKWEGQDWGKWELEISLANWNRYRPTVDIGDAFLVYEMLKQKRAEKAAYKGFSDIKTEYRARIVRRGGVR
jgi:hypothetical protein